MTTDTMARVWMLTLLKPPFKFFDLSVDTVTKAFFYYMGYEVYYEMYTDQWMMSDGPVPPMGWVRFEVNEARNVWTFHGKDIS